MSLRNEIRPFIDVNELVAPNRCSPDMRGSDNGPMFTSEYYIMLKKLGEAWSWDYSDYYRKIFNCMTRPGLLARAPGDDGQEGPDDYYGIFAGAKVMEQPQIAQMVINYGWKNRGIFNNKNPGKFTRESFLIRQPQLIAAAYSAAGRTPLWLLPVYFYTALVILTSCITQPKDRTGLPDADSRRLSWLLIQAVSDSSWMCQMAAKVWFRRLYKTFPNGMKDVAALYYRDGHPFTKYWVD